jgi:choline transport protein
MNYTCLIVGGFILLETLWWFKAGKKYTAKMSKAREDSVDVTPQEI